MDKKIKETQEPIKPLSRSTLLANKKKQKIKHWLKTISVILLALIGTGIITSVAVFAWFAKDLPNPDEINERIVAESTKIYDKTGTTLLYEAGRDVRRTSISLSDVNDYAKWATIDLEDKHFYEHAGFDWRGIIRSVYINLATGQRVGGSSLTQQFVGNAIVGKEKTYTRKIKELILAIEMERKYSKDEILTMYLNEISYGGVNYGISAAANSYFGKSPKDLTLAEACTLASIPQRPTTYISNLDLLKDRRNYCLNQMEEQGHAKKEDIESAKAETLELQKEVVYKKAPHFVDYVISKLEDDFGSSFMNQGLKVTTSLDWDKQQIAEQVISDHMDSVRSYGGSNAALVNIDTKTGQVLAMVGSYDYYAEDYDGQVNVATSGRQPGSSFKPIVYYTAFTKGYTPDTTIYDLTTTFPTDSGGYTPHNYSGSTSGPMKMKSALANSLNIPAVKTLYLAGIDKVLDVANSLGYTTFADRSRFGLALVLGGGEVKLLEHTSAFATLSREGVRHPVATILKVEDKNDNVLYEWKNEESQVLDQPSVQRLNQVLSDSSLRPSYFSKLSIKGHTVAAKTGTTQEWRDAWTMGYTPSFAVGVWVGNNDNTSMGSSADGGVVAAPIWNDYFSQILEGLPDETFNEPPPVNATKPVLWGATGTTVKKKVDKITGKIIPDECVESYPKEYVEEREFKKAHEILYYVNKDDPNGDAPKNPADDPMFSAWEGPVQAWATGQEGYITDETEYESCDLRKEGQKPTIKISSPTDKSEVTSKTFYIKTSYTVGSGRAVSKIVYMIDTNVIDTKTSAPFDSTFAPTNLTSGRHTLTVTIYDDKGDQASATISFTFTNTSPSKNTNTNSNINKNSNTNKKKN
jgi:penicillin-binding protein 1C